MKSFRNTLVLILLFFSLSLFAQQTILKLPAADTSASFNVKNSSNAPLLRLNGDAGFYLGGTYGTGAIPTTGAGTRLMWYPAKAAFRAGYINGTQWDDDSIGNNSIALGLNTTASGGSSIALGNGSRASGSYAAAAIGYHTIASGNASSAMGWGTTAQAYASVVIGRYNVVGGDPANWVGTDPLFVIGNGTSVTDTSNAVTVLKNGNTGIGTSHPDATLEVAGQIKITGGSPGAGKVLTSDANGLASWSDANGNISLNSAYNNGSTITANSGAVTIAGTDGLISTGTYGSGTALSVSGAGTRMIWYPAKAAFRAGYVNGTQWDDANIGVYSIALGNNTTASGIDAIAMGAYTTASGTAAAAMGYKSIASGNASSAMGWGTTAQAYASVAIGRYNVIGGDPVNWVGTDPLFVIGNGTSATDTSNAVTVLKNGNTGIGTSHPDATLEVAGQIKITGGSPGAGKVLTSDANGLASGSDATSGSDASGNLSLNDAYNNGATITALSGAVTIAGTDGLISTGTYGRGTALSVSGAGTRMIWYPLKAAFRAGCVNGMQWNADNIGNYSIALGYNTTASGYYSMAFGQNTMASGSSSIAIGYQTKASGDESTAMGYQTTASGTASTAMGISIIASGEASTAMGGSTKASGEASTAMGAYTTASGIGSTAMGLYTTASGDESTAMGTNVSTNGYQGAIIIGDNTTSDTTFSTAANQMMMRFSGGYVLYTNSGATLGVSLAAGGNSWSQISDSTKKYAFLPINGDSVLEKINKFNMRTWSYKGQDSTKFRHYGPMAQEFFNAFGHDKYGVSGNDTTINQADLMGVNMTAIQALIRRTNKLKAQCAVQRAALKAENTKMKDQVSVLSFELSKTTEENAKMKDQIAQQDKKIAELRKNFDEMKTLMASIVRNNQHIQK